MTASQDSESPPRLRLVEEKNPPSATRGQQDTGPSDAGATTAGAYVFPELMQEFFLPVWGQVRLTASEVRVVDHPAFARLGDIYQLGQTWLVYRGATHKRWEHALGTLQAAQVIIAALERNHREAETKKREPLAGKWRRAAALAPQEVAFVRLAALLHDIGHVAAGHTFEDELGLLDKHDTDPRLIHVLDREVWRGGSEPATLRQVIDTEYAAAAEATELDLTASEVLLELVSKTRLGKWKDGKAEERRPARSTAEFRINVCRDIVGNTICADLLDYLQRDWHHLGKERHFDSRLLDYFEIRESLEVPGDAHLIVNLREAAEVRADAVTAIFELLESRYQLGEIALFHRTKLTASAMLERLVAEIADAADDPAWLANHVDRLLECSDEELVELLLTLGEDVAGLRADERGERLRNVLGLGRALRYRQLHKPIMAFKSFELPRSLTFVREQLGGAAGSANRLAACRSLEMDFHLPAGSVVMYCPASVPHAKIARVQVLINGQLDELANLEEDRNDPAMTCGLLAAQRKRFEGLWRVQVSVSPAAYRQLYEQHVQSDFERTVECLVLKAHRGTASVNNIAFELADKLIANPDFDTADAEVVSSEEADARAANLRTYPTGAPTLSSLMAPATGAEDVSKSRARSKNVRPRSAPTDDRRSRARAAAAEAESAKRVEVADTLRIVCETFGEDGPTDEEFAALLTRRISVAARTDQPPTTAWVRETLNEIRSRGSGKHQHDLL